MKPAMKRRRKAMRLKAKLWKEITRREAISNSWKHTAAKQWVLGRRYGDAVEPSVLELIDNL
jgi:hypothetical protein